MKKKSIRIWILIVALLLCAGAAAYAYAATAVRAGEPPAVLFAGHTAAPVRSSFAEPVLGGLLQKRLVEETENLQIDLGTLGTRSLPLETDFQLLALWTLWNGEIQVFQGTPLEYQAFSFTENGSYRATLQIDLPESADTSEAEFFYEFVFELDVRPKVLFSSDRALQGDLLSVYVNRGFETMPPTIETDLGTVVFLPLSPDEFIAYVPVNYARELGKWDIEVRLGEQSYIQPVIVTGRTYGKQYMTISQATTDATMNNPEGPSNWANRIKVLWETYDVEKYWTETFLQPCEGPISTEFGLYRYTNDNPVPARHSGIDIAVPTGTPVLASNSGRVVRAESIIYTGNTVVIEHGGGLKTYYYHMNSLDVKEGQHVERGTLIGKVGSTGYSTGAHLHFEVKMGRSSLSPWELFDGSSEVYFTGDFLK
ncbi:MAG: M23 family metallopeptidase [Eubacteriales bacterium]|nr:M23 family metallopeptidase [Eubacteriales bacterium]